MKVKFIVTVDVDTDIWEGRTVTDAARSHGIDEGFSCPDNYPAPYTPTRLRDDVRSYLAASLDGQAAAYAGAYTIVSTNAVGWDA